MADIGVQGIDCSTIEPMRNAIEALYKLEVNSVLSTLLFFFYSFVSISVPYSFIVMSMRKY